MSLLSIRKTHVLLEEIYQEMGQNVDSPPRKVTVAAVIHNPCAGEYQEDLKPLYGLGEEIGGYLAEKGDRPWASSRIRWKAMVKAP